MELLHETNIDFMKYRKFWIWISLALVLLGVVWMVFPTRLNFGIDFAGGTQVTLRFKQEPEIDELRHLLERAGMSEALIQRFGDRGSNEVIIKTAAAKANEEGNLGRILAALNTRYNQGQAGKPDLNRIGLDAITQFLLQADPDGVKSQGDSALREHYGAVAGSLQRARHDAAIFSSWDEIARVQGVSPRAVDALKQRTFLGDYSVLGTENVGPQIGRELRLQGFLAVALSLLGMLVYIWFRFELRFGIGAVMASLHDVMVTFGLFVLFGFEFNLTTVAAFLTLIGYSVNDTVVIFDRIRENMRKNRRKPLIDTMNEAINQTLSRTIMTSGLTMLTTAALLALGGDVLRGFAFVMTVGIVVGTYSSIYIASPFALLWEQLFGAKTRDRGKTAAGPAPVAKPPAEPAKPIEPGRPVEPGAKTRPRARAGRR